MTANTDRPILCDIPDNPVPPGARAGYFQTEDGVRLRYGRFARTGDEHRGTVCLVQGRTEFIEKYFETITDFQKRGFAVATFDLRGQGGSDRLIGNGRLGHVDQFEDYWIDLKSFHSRILLPDCPPPYYLVGHSTGGLVSLLAAARDRLMFDRVFVTSPMIGLPGLPFSPRACLVILNALRFVGLSGIPLQRRVDATQRFETNVITHDAKRFARMMAVLASRPDLGVGAPTIGWVSAALSGITTAQSVSFPSRLQIPTFIAAAGNDRVVSTAATEQLALRMRTGHHVVLAGAHHELFMETDMVRNQVFAAFDAFVTDQTR
ncbi:alpha/beta fold hydrolase [Pelagibacterium montanilacus]|uniref:alpha/beta fold hydrolase n=1 Tax=Pelagibacterium montanilacus TaxID=2185280 RepID=UPI0013DFFD33|nr:alpha/beta hydrolase [Pelagibacterium montanilacus]